jgi:FMN reductase
MALRVVGIGGSLRVGSSSERALRAALAGARELGAETSAVTGDDLVLPFYDPSVPERVERARRLVAAARGADGVVLAAPGYHGTLSGLVKNALDYLEDLREDPFPYLDGRAVGCIGVAYGWQATVHTVDTLRGIAHSLRGWPTPLGVAVNSAQVKFDENGDCSDAGVGNNLRILGNQVAEFALARQRPPSR